MTIDSANMGEQPIFSCKAHVFHIDPKTKRSWIPASTSAVSVSFFYDSTRQLYRIISVEGPKAVINSTITPNMMFTKTSQKFGQWSDMRANTVYGLGFSTEAELNKFIEKFQDVKEAIRSVKTNGTVAQGQQGGTPQTGPMNTANVTVSGSNVINANIGPIPGPASHGGPPSASASPLTTRTKIHDQPIMQPPADVSSISSGLQSTGESPKHKGQAPPQPDKGQGVESQAQLKYENDRLKLALAQSSANAKKWEIELNSLKTTNARLTAALQESTANVEEWKKQLQTYKEENSRMKSRVMELETGRVARGGSVGDMDDAAQDLAALSLKVDTLSSELESKDNMVEDLKSQLQRARPEELKEKLQNEENEQMRLEIGRCQSQLEVAMATQDSQRGVVESVNLQLGERIKDLLALHHELNHLLTT